MLAIALVTLVLLAATLPVVIASAALVRRAWPGARAGETWLAASLLTPLALMIELAALGSIPNTIASRPLDALAWAHGLVWAACLWFAWHERGRVRGLWARTLAGLRSARDAAPLPLRILAAGALVWHALATLLGMWHWSAEMDDLRYHLPQAVQPFVDGRLGLVHAGVVWADSFPRGVALLWSWTLVLTGHDAGMHLVNGAAGLMLALAAAVGARRLGADRAGAGLAAAAVLPAPIVGYLTGLCYTDLPLGAFIAAAAVFAMPDSRKGEVAHDAPRFRIALAGLGLMLALWGKFQPAPPAAAIGVATLSLAWSGGPRRIGSTLIIFTTFALLASIPYLLTWRDHGSPVFPLQLRLGQWVLFPGPMDPDTIGASAQGPWASRFVRYWLDFLSPIGPETPGSLGPVFALILLPIALGAALIQPGRAFRRDAGPQGLVVIAALLLVVVAVPLMHWPRYSVWLLPGTAAVAGLVFSHAPGPARSALAALTLTLSIGGGAMFARYASTTIERTLANLPDSVAWWHDHASRHAADRHDFTPVWASPATREAIRRAARPGDAVVHATPTPSVLMTDAGYTYRVHHRPARAWPGWWTEGFDPLTSDGGKPWGQAEAATWADGLVREGVRVVVVIRGSAEDEVMKTAQGEGTPWAVLGEDSASRGRWALRVYGRNAK